MEETLPVSAKANVEALYNQSEKLRFLIDSLIKLSRLENGIISLSPQRSALQPLLQGIAEQYAAKVSKKGLSLQLQDTDAFAVFDFKWTAEALANIVDIVSPVKPMPAEYYTLAGNTISYGGNLQGRLQVKLNDAFFAIGRTNEPSPLTDSFLFVPSLPTILTSAAGSS